MGFDPRIFDGKNFETAPEQLDGLKPFTLEHFAAWIASNIAREAYCFTEAGTCLVTQYFHANGGSGPEDVPSKYSTVPHKCGYRDKSGRLVVESYDHPFMKIAIGSGDNSEFTFGAALSRAKSLLGKE